MSIQNRDALEGLNHELRSTVGQLPNEPANMWHKYFGDPLRDLRTDPNAKRGYKTWELPDAYNGRNGWLRDTINTAIYDTADWYTSACLPYEHTDQIHWQWNEWHFEPTYVGQVPEEGVSRLIESSRSQGEAHSVRRGLGFILEHGFMNTPEGHLQYQRNITQIAASVQETNNYDVLAALLNARTLDKVWHQKHSAIHTPWSQLGAEQRNAFAMVQKNKYGLESLTERTKQMLRRNNAEPNLWILPPGMKRYASLTQDHEKAPYDRQLRAYSDSDQFLGLQVFETKEFNVYAMSENRDPIDLLEKVVQIGELYHLRNPEKDHAKYTTANSMAIVVYDESKDGWARIGVDDVFERCGRFHADGSLSTPRLDGNDEDLFRFSDDEFVKSSRQWAERFGQMESKFLGKEAIRAVAESAAARLPALWGTQEDFDAQLNTMWAELRRRDNDNALPTAAALGESVQAIVVDGLEFLESGLTAQNSSNLAWEAISEDSRNTITDLYRHLQTLFPTMGFDRSVLTAWERILLGEETSAAQRFYDMVLMPRPYLWVRSEAPPTAPTVEAVMGLAKAKFDVDLPAAALTDAAVRRAVVMLIQQGTTKKALEKFEKHKDWRALLDRARATASAGSSTAFVRTRYKLSRARLSSSRTDNRDFFVMPTDDGVAEPRNVAEHHEGLQENMHPIGSAVPSLGHLLQIAPSARGAKRGAPAAFGRSARQRTGMDDYVTSQDTVPIAARYGRATVGGDPLNVREENPELANELDGNHVVITTDRRNFTIHGKHDAYKRHVATLRTPMARLCAWCLYYAKIERKAFDALLTNDVALPVAFIAARPRMTYRMASAIMMKGGADTGNTFVGHTDFQLGDDVASKIHKGNFTYYSKAVVRKPENVAVVQHVYSKGYVRGNDMQWVDPRAPEANANASLFAFMVPYNEHGQKANPLSLFSRVNNEDPAYTMTGYAFYRHLYSKGRDPTEGEAISAISETADDNDICYQGHQFYWKPYRDGGGDHSSYTLNTGHWGPGVYPGCGRVRNGEWKYLNESYDYSRESIF